MKNSLFDNTPLEINSIAYHRAIVFGFDSGRSHKSFSIDFPIVTDLGSDGTGLLSLVGGSEIFLIFMTV